MKKNVFAVIRISQWHCQIQRRQLGSIVMRTNNADMNTNSFVMAL